MVFSDAPVLRTETELFLRYDGLTESGLMQFTILSSIEHRFGGQGSITETEEVIYLEMIEPITNYIHHLYDAVYLIGSFEILTNYKTNITSLSTVFYYEYFLWKYMHARLVRAAGTDL